MTLKMVEIEIGDNKSSNEADPEAVMPIELKDKTSKEQLRAETLSSEDNDEKCRPDDLVNRMKSAFFSMTSSSQVKVTD